MSKQIPVKDLLSSIKNGDRVTILIPNGRNLKGMEWAEKTGKCVIAPDGRSQINAVLNFGGQYGTPGVATDQNLVRVGNQRIAYYNPDLNESRCDS